jgi:hypothetical protein
MAGSGLRRASLDVWSRLVAGEQRIALYPGLRLIDGKAPLSLLAWQASKIAGCG